MLGRLSRGSPRGGQAGERVGGGTSVEELFVLLRLEVVPRSVKI